MECERLTESPLVESHTRELFDTQKETYNKQRTT